MMTDKEQIMIDGVDVDKCFFSRYDENEKIYICDLMDFDGHYCDCRKNSNCYFKQLARKTRECEELEEEYTELKLENKELYRILADLKEVRKLKDSYRMALEEIEEYINNQGIDNKWNMRIQKFRSGILDIINKAKDGN